MSYLFRHCEFRRAHDDEHYLQKLMPRLVAAMSSGRLQVWKCYHDPPCRELTDEESDALQQRMDQWRASR